MPAPVVERAVRLVEHNAERFAKVIRPGPARRARSILAPDASDEIVRLERAMRTWPDDDSTRAVLARTNRELLPAVIVALGLGVPFRAPRIDLPLDSPIVDGLLEAAAHARSPASRRSLRSDGSGPRPWTSGERRTPRSTRSPQRSSAGRSASPTLPRSRRPSPRRGAAADLRRDDAALTLATAHGTKGLEFDHVIVIGMEAGRFPSARAVARPTIRSGRTRRNAGSPTSRGLARVAR